MTKESMLSPGFRSAAAMAGWDEEALLHASLIVDDTPVRESRHKRRINPNFKTPPSSNTSRYELIQSSSFYELFYLGNILCPFEW